MISYGLMNFHYQARTATCMDDTRPEENDM